MDQLVKKKSSLSKAYSRVQKNLFVYSGLICLFAYSFIYLFPEQSWALTMSNDNYQLQGNPNSLSEITEDEEAKKAPAPDTIEKDRYQGENYQVLLGYGEKNSLEGFGLSVSKELIDYGVLTATNPVLRTNILTITSPASGYQILATESNPLQFEDTLIPDTTCDNGSCTPNLAAEWSNTLTYGFGYACKNKQGLPCAKDFLQDNYYRQFANSEKKEPLAPLLSSELRQKKESAEIIYKLTISGTQREGSYSNIISYLAVPGY